MSSTPPPASEWASSTLSALDDTTTSQSPQVETPALSMPGSFPFQNQGLVTSDVASDALKTAKEYAQMASQGAQNAVQTAGEKVGEYLPSSVASYLPSAPGGASEEAQKSNETSQNDHSSTLAGVGTLPGPPLPAKTGVTPHDSVASTKTSPILTTTNNNPLPRLPSDPTQRHTGYIPGTLQDDTSLAKLPEERRLENLPSHDDESSARLGKSGGVGALPGSAGESSVALLPDERKKEETQQEEQQQPPLHSGEASTDASTRTLPGSSQYTPSYNNYTPSPLGQSHFVPQTTGREHAFSRDEEKVFGAEAKKDLDVPEEAIDTTTATTKVDNETVLVGDTGEFGAAADKEQHTTHAVGAGSGGLAGAGSAKEVESEMADVPKKSGFIHKVKGEMKILSGKMSHNENKIEEGRKMMGKN